MTDAAPQPIGSSILTQGIPLDAPAAKGSGGTPPAQAEQKPAVSQGIADAQKAAQRPEWAPEKYWKADSNQVDVENLAKGYKSLETLLGRDKVPIPVSDDDQEGWDRWYKATGRPDDDNGYEFARPDKLPEGLAYDEDLEKDFRASAYGMGLNKRQASGLYDKFVKSQIDRYGAHETSKQQLRAKAETDLRRELGGEFDKSMTQAKVAMQTYADPEFKQFLETSGMGNDPRMIRAFIRIGKELNGETRVVGRPAEAVNSADMERTIGEFNSKHSKALFDRDHPEHKTRVAERAKLYEMAYPSQ